MTVTASPVREETAPEPAAGRSLIDKVFKARELAVVSVLVAMLAATQLSNTEFLSEQGVTDLLLNATILVLVATGQAVVVITRNVDLSVGSVLGISAFAAGNYLQDGGSSLIAMVLAVAIGALFGVLNGALVGLGKVAGPRRHSRHALRCTRHRLHLGRLAADHGRRPARRLRRLRPRRHLGRALPGAPRRRRTPCRRLLPAQLPQRPRDVRARLKPRGRRPGLRPRPQAHHDRVCAVRGARRTRRSPLPGPVRQRRLGHRKRLRTHRRQRRRGRRRRVHRRQRLRIRRGPRGAAAHLDQQRSAA